MTKNNFILALVLILLVNVFIWLFLFNTNQERYELVELNQIELEIFQCERDNGIWLDDYGFCHFYHHKEAERLKTSCENLNGIWLSESKLYECEIDGHTWKFGEWEDMDWDMYEEYRLSCQNMDGEYIGGRGMVCELDGDEFFHGEWELIPERKESCLDYDGIWLGGFEFKCEIDGEVYYNNWENAIAEEDSCLHVGGAWDSEERSCLIDGLSYENRDWNKLDEMQESCEEYGGEFLAGSDFQCEINEELYTHGTWETVSIAIDLKQLCLDENAEWLQQNQVCRGVSQEWCANLSVEYDIVNNYGYRASTMSCYVY